MRMRIGASILPRRYGKPRKKCEANAKVARLRRLVRQNVGRTSALLIGSPDLPNAVHGKSVKGVCPIVFQYDGRAREWPVR